ncbi:hypothetical protein Sjap_003231 [Stephania japonica]|uniref:Uncharacterized protein n=1 Tax=Stephania japonica TaxID=461633 RepID=A0AAP0KNC2_9MAGN
MKLCFSVFVILCFTISNGYAWKTPFHPIDVLPLLPKRVSWPILNTLRSAVDLLPSFVGTASSSSDDALEWKGACFYKNEAWMEFHNKSGSEFGGGTLHLKVWIAEVALILVGDFEFGINWVILNLGLISYGRAAKAYVTPWISSANTEVSNAHSWTCMDLYIFATPYRVTWDYYFLAREHTLEFNEWEGKAEYEYVKNKGVSIFLMESGMLGTLRALWDVFPLFTNTGWGENANLAFLKKHMKASFEQRPQPWVTNITVDDVHSGDFLAISKIRGRWGGFETLEKWVTGAYAGHTAVLLKDTEGKLWVGESGHENEKGEDIIAILPWDEWWTLELTKDDSNPHIALLPLRPDLRAKFNETAAWEYAKSMNGKPYGYHNMIFSWIDTLDGNYPPPLDANLVASAYVSNLCEVASVMTMWSHIQPDYAANMWNEALNRRLETKDLDLPQILVETEKRGWSFDKLLTIPERDDWIYSDGKSTSCVVFILEMYKQAGLFGSLADSIQVTEFTIKDAYTLNFFENDESRLPKWCNEGDDVKLPFCQIRGQYRMELPGYNTMKPYSHMNERCPSLPPEYHRSPNC